MEMDWRQRRTVTILSGILAVLFAAVLIILGIRYQASRPAPQEDQTETGIIDQADHSALSYYNGTATLSFALDEEGNWVWADDPDFPLNDATVTTLLKQLAELKPQQILTPEPEEDLATYGLDTPAATVTATQENGSTISLELGKTTTDGDSYYMMKNGDKSTLYIIADTIYRTMQTPIYDMCRLPELPVLAGESLQTLFIQGAAPAAEEGQEHPNPAPTWNLLARWAEISRMNLWFQGDNNVTGSEKLLEMVSDLQFFTVTKCVDYNPSEDAVSLCGFDSPAATLRVGYTTEEGVQETFTLVVGDAAFSGGGRYVRINDDASIYLAPDNCVDALLAIAAGGLEDSAGEPGDAAGEPAESGT